MLDWRGTGMSVMENGHRSDEFCWKFAETAELRMCVIGMEISDD